MNMVTAEGGGGNSGVCVRVPPLLFGRTVWCAGWSGLGGGAQPLLSGLHALDLQFLRSNNRRCELSGLTVQLTPSSVTLLLLRGSWPDAQIQLILESKWMFRHVFL